MSYGSDGPECNKPGDENKTDSGGSSANIIQRVSSNHAVDSSSSNRELELATDAVMRNGVQLGNYGRSLSQAIPVDGETDEDGLRRPPIERRFSSIERRFSSIERRFSSIESRCSSISDCGSYILDDPPGESDIFVQVEDDISSNFQSSLSLSLGSHNSRMPAAIDAEVVQPDVSQRDAHVVTTNKDDTANERAERKPTMVHSEDDTHEEDTHDNEGYVRESMVVPERETNLWKGGEPAKGVDHQLTIGDLIGVRSNSFADTQYARLFKVEHPDFGTVVLKEILKSHLSSNEFLIPMMQSPPHPDPPPLHHENMVLVYDVMEDSSRVGIIEEYAGDMDLMELIYSKDWTNCSREDKDLHAVNLLTQLMELLSYHEENGILHRDIKPDNIRVTMHKGKPWKLTLVDYEFSTIVQSGRLQVDESHLYGTYRYMAPEALEQTDCGYSFPVDMWGAGATAYQLLSEQYPWYWAVQPWVSGKEHNLVFEIPNKKSELSKRVEQDCKCYELLKSLVIDMLNPDASARITPFKALQRLDLIWKQLSRPLEFP